MRRKDLTYYFNTVKLKLANRKFLRISKTDQYIQEQEKRSDLLKSKYNKSALSFPEFNLFYKTYFYFDSTDIFSTNYEFKNGFPIGMKNGHQVPLIPLYFGLVYINTAFNTTSFDLQLLKNIANFTIENSTVKGNTLLLEHGFDYSIFGLKAPWTSGITQAIASSFFLRLYSITKDKAYLSQAEKYFKACTSEEDCLTVTKSGLEWVEEYKSNPTALVLSGHIFAIIAAGELHQLTFKDEYKFYTENWLRSLVAELSSYQYEEYLIHNKFQWKFSNIEYQGLNVGQFLHLYELTGNEVFLELYKYYDSRLNWDNFNRFYGIKKQ